MRGLTKRYRRANRQLKAARLGQLSFACPADVIVPHARKRDFRERKASVFDQARISRPLPRHAKNDLTLDAGQDLPPITRLGRRVLFAIEAVEAWELGQTAA